LTVSIGRSGRFVVVKAMWTECSVCVVLALACRIFEASGNGSPGVVAVALVAVVPDAPVVSDGVDDLDPHPVTTVAKTVAATKVATDHVGSGRRDRRR
jgi:hypothetical protein